MSEHEDAADRPNAQTTARDGDALRVPASQPAPGPDADALLFRWSDLPLVTASYPGTGGRIRCVPEDFKVDEIPLYLPSGRGSHLFVRIEKRDLTTRELVLALTAQGLPEAQVGVAGLKDKHAVTTQWLSVPNRAAESIELLEALPGVRVLECARHSNKLGIGHLKGNRFVVKVRAPDADVGVRAAAILDQLVAKGVPNYFGPQRFGRYGSNAIDGYKAAVGAPTQGGKRLGRFFVSALQSIVFNALLARRIEAGRYEQVVQGDWARKHDTGGTFLVEDAALESVRSRRLEISATLPLFGRKVRLSSADAGRLEEEVLERLGLRWSTFSSRRGDRRLTRVTLSDVGFGTSEDGFEVAFTLPRGSYATVVLRELMKTEIDAPLPYPPPGSGDDPAGSPFASAAEAAHDQLDDEQGKGSQGEEGP